MTFKCVIQAADSVEQPDKDTDRLTGLLTNNRRTRGTKKQNKFKINNLKASRHGLIVIWSRRAVSIATGGISPIHAAASAGIRNWKGDGETGGWGGSDGDKTGWRGRDWGRGRRGRLR